MRYNIIVAVHDGDRIKHWRALGISWQSTQHEELYRKNGIVLMSYIDFITPNIYFKLWSTL